MKNAVITAVTFCSLVAGCLGADADVGGTPRAYGFVGLRLLPHDAVQAKERWLSGIGNYEDIKGQYPFVAENADVVWGPRGCFKTDKVFIEHYLPFDRDRIDPNPKTNPLVREIRKAEESGLNTACGPVPTNQVTTSRQVMEHILVCREAELVGKGRRGPFPQDSRILYRQDVDDLRKLFRDAHAAGILKHDNYKLIQMVAHPSFFADNAEAREIVKLMDGIAYECHQFNRHWPLETGWSRPEPVVKGAKWTLDQGKEYIFYYGPFIFKGFAGYHDFVERDWLYQFWKAGLPKRNPRMHYYLNAFPHAGCKRPVGPESDPHSNLGMMKWLIQELRAEPNTQEGPAKIGNAS